MLQAAIVEARAAAQSIAGRVECNQRQQNEIECSYWNDFVGAMLGFGDTVAVYAHHAIFVVPYELHAVTSKVGDDGKVEQAAPAPGQSDDAIQVRFVPVREVNRNTSICLQERRASEAASELSMSRCSLERRERTTQPSNVPA